MTTGAVAAFAVGDAVRVREAYPPTHMRTPLYVQGKRGIVDELYGAFPNPEELAYSRDGLPKVRLYRVVFDQPDLWAGYPGPANDTLCMDIYEHWLEPVERGSR